MEVGTGLHSTDAEDGGDLDHGFHVVGGIKEREAFGEDGEQDDACGPDVDFGALFSAFEEHFWGSEAAGASSVCAARGTGVVFRVAGRGAHGSGDAVGDAAAAFDGRVHA